MLLPVSPLLPLRFSLSWNFAILIMMCLAVAPLDSTLCASWISVTFSLIKLGKFSIISFQTGFHSFLLLFSFWYHYHMNIITFHVVLHSLNPSLYFLSLFFLFLMFLGIFFYLALQLVDMILYFIQPAFDSFYCVLQLRNCILSLLALVDCFYVLFHADVILGNSQ